jgi:hypothetical protein
LLLAWWSAGAAIAANPVDNSVDRAKDAILAELLKKVEESSSDQAGIRQAQIALANMGWLGPRVHAVEGILLRELSGSRGDALASSIGHVLVIIGPQERKVVEVLAAEGKISKSRATAVYRVFANVDRARSGWTPSQTPDSNDRRVGARDARRTPPSQPWERRVNLENLRNDHVLLPDDVRRALDDDQADIRAVGVDYLRDANLSEKDWTILTPLLLDMETPVGRRSLSQVLRDHGHAPPNAESAMITFYNTPQLRQAIQHYLARTGLEMESSVEMILKELSNADGTERLAAATILGKCRVGREQVLRALAVTEGADPDPSVRSAALGSWTLALEGAVAGKGHDVSAATIEERHARILPVVTEILRDRRTSKRVCAAALFRILKMRVDVLDLRDLYLEELRHPEGSQEWALGKAGVCRALQSERSCAGEEFWKALHESNKETSTNLERLLRQEPAGLRMWSLALARGTSAERKTALQVVAGSERLQYVEHSQRQCLDSDTFRKDLLNGLMQCAGDADPDVRADTVRTLAILVEGILHWTYVDIANQPRACKVIVAAIDDPDARVRNAAFSVLAESDGQWPSGGGASDVLARRVQSEERDGKVLAWRALAKESSRGRPLSLASVPGFEATLRDAVWEMDAKIREPARTVWGWAYPRSELPPPPGWWVVQLLTAVAGISCLVLAILAVWGAARPHQPCVAEGRRQRALAAAGRSACGTGTILAIGGLVLMGLLIWQSQGHIGSLLGILGLMILLAMFVGGLAFIAWGLQMPSGRTLDVVLAAILACGSTLFFGLSFVNDLLLGATVGFRIQQGDISGYLILDGAVVAGSTWVLAQIICASLFASRYDPVT